MNISHLSRKCKAWDDRIASQAWRRDPLFQQVRAELQHRRQADAEAAHHRPGAAAPGAGDLDICQDLVKHLGYSFENLRLDN